MEEDESDVELGVSAFGNPKNGAPKKTKKGGSKSRRKISKKGGFEKNWGKVRETFCVCGLRERYDQVELSVF